MAQGAVASLGLELQRPPLPRARPGPPSFREGTGPWLYGDSEAHTEYVQNEFLTSRVERHPFGVGSFGRGLREPRRPRGAPSLVPVPSPHRSPPDSDRGCFSPGRRLGLVPTK